MTICTYCTSDATRTTSINEPICDDCFYASFNDHMEATHPSPPTSARLTQCHLCGSFHDASHYCTSCDHLE